MANRTRNKSDPAAILQRPTISPDQLYKAKVFDLGRNTIYEACADGTIECFRVGKKIMIPTAPLRRKLGIAAA